MLETEGRAIDEVMNLEQECPLQQTRDDNMTNISIYHAHPIVYYSRNFYDFFCSQFLSLLKILQQQFVQVRLKCKQPYIDILEEPVKGCECHRNKWELFVPTVISQYISLLERNTLKHV